jgi:hypothetical protein
VTQRLTDRPYEPEILPPDRRDARASGDASRVWISVQTAKGRRWTSSAPGPLGTALALLVLAILSVAIGLVLLGAFLIWIPLVFILVALVLVFGFVRGGFRRLRG